MRCHIEGAYLSFEIVNDRFAPAVIMGLDNSTRLSGEGPFSAGCGSSSAGEGAARKERDKLAFDISD